MNKIIKEQLTKCKVAVIPGFDDTTVTMIIPNKQGNVVAPEQDLTIGGHYKIFVEDYIINPFPGFDLHDNWNNGIAPTDNKMSIVVTNIMGKMIKVNAVGLLTESTWEGWLPRKAITLLED